MKKVVAVLAAVLLSVAVIAPVYAQQAQAPKGTEGPDIRKQEPKGTEGPDVRKKAKKKTASSQAPKGTEGPDVRKSEQKKQ
jgi:hypothetical protein